MNKHTVLRVVSALVLVVALIACAKNGDGDVGICWRARFEYNDDTHEVTVHVIAKNLDCQGIFEFAKVVEYGHNPPPNDDGRQHPLHSHETVGNMHDGEIVLTFTIDPSATEVVIDVHESGGAVKTKTYQVPK